MDPSLRQFLSAAGASKCLALKVPGETDADRDILTGCGGRIVSRRAVLFFGAHRRRSGKSQ